MGALSAISRRLESTKKKNWGNTPKVQKFFNVLKRDMGKFFCFILPWDLAIKKVVTRELKGHFNNGMESLMHSSL